MTAMGTRRRAPRVGESAPRPDGVPKVQGRFAFGSDLWAEGMLWGKTLRSPHASARIVRLDVAPALLIPGVRCVLTHEDVTGSPYYGLEHIGLTVDNVDEAVAELRAKGAEIAFGPVTRSAGLRLAFIRGPEGIMIELVQES